MKVIPTEAGLRDPRTKLAIVTVWSSESYPQISLYVDDVSRNSKPVDSDLAFKETQSTDQPMAEGRQKPD